MKSRFENALASAPESLSHHLAPIILAADFDASLSTVQFDELLKQTGMTDNQLRVALLPFAAAYSYAPISEFYVGAIVLVAYLVLFILARIWSLMGSSLDKRFMLNNRLLVTHG